jgi:hypothetical protein
MMNLAVVTEQVRAVADQFAGDRGNRQLRKELVAADFDQLTAAGLHLTGVLAEHGGLWESVERSTRPVCTLLRLLAGGDSSLALVCAMHPAVLAFWLANPQVTPASQAGWNAQRDQVSQTAYRGAWWGTITSEPGSGGDIFQTKAVRGPMPTGYHQRPKTFWQRIGSPRSITTAIVEG